MSEKPLTHGQARQLAVDYYDNGKGWPIQRIRQRLAERGVRVGWATVRRWVMTEAEADEHRRAAAERARQYWRAKHGVARVIVFDEQALRQRVTDLAGIGLDPTAIAAVVQFDHHVSLTVARVEQIIAGQPARPAPDPVRTVIGQDGNGLRALRKSNSPRALARRADDRQQAASAARIKRTRPPAEQIRAEAHRIRHQREQHSAA